MKYLRKLKKNYEKIRESLSILFQLQELVEEEKDKKKRCYDEIIRYKRS